MDTATLLPPMIGRPASPRMICPAQVAVAHQRVLHQLARRELQLLAGLVWATAHDDPARAAMLVEHAGLVRGLVDQHHALERDLLWPALLRGVPPILREDCRSRVHDWSGQVTLVAAALDDLAAAGTRWESESGPEAQMAFAGACSRAAQGLWVQTRAEEESMLPLLTAYLSSTDWAEIVRRSEDPIVGRPDMRVLGLALDAASAVDQARLLVTLPPAARTAWHLHGRRAHRSAVDRVLAGSTIS